MKIVSASTSLMALAARHNFSFLGLSNLLPLKTFIFQSPIVFLNLKSTFTAPLHCINKPKIHRHFALFSIDVSKDDKPLSHETPSQMDPRAAEYEQNVEEKKFDRWPLQERLAVLNTGIYECRSCGYRYNEAVGDPSYPIPPGFRFEKLPQDWRCSTCGAAKSFFDSKSVEIAGFEQNQNFGFGANTLTGGQKALLIYGSLLLAFALFLSGYFLQ